MWVSILSNDSQASNALLSLFRFISVLSDFAEQLYQMIEQVPSNSSKEYSQTDIIKHSNGAIITNQSDSDQERSPQQLSKRSTYGNMKVLYNSGRVITIGPDYCCFIPTFLLFSVVSFLVIQLVFTTTENIYFRLITAIVCIGEPLSYLIVALSNPGIITQSADHLSEHDRKTCSKCAMIVPRHSRHCKDCDVCVEYYDHHCPWTSKCIGGSNLIQFYVFLGWTPIYLIYITVAFVACMSSNLIKIQQVPPKLF